MPPWFIDIESATEIEAKSNGTPLAPRMPAQASRANSPSSAVHGVTRPSVEATPTKGLPRSASDRPSARRNARWGARSSPSTVMREGSFAILMFRSHSKRQRQGGKMLRAVLALLLLSVNAAAWPQAYPARAVRSVVPFATGGPADIYARFLGGELQGPRRQPFVIQDRPGPGTPYHMAGELCKAMAGVDIVHVPHKGSDQARTAILGGQVQMMFDAITTMAGNARAGKVHALGTTGNRRSLVMPETPTLAEAGVPG